MPVSRADSGDVIRTRQFAAACVAVACTAGVFFVALLYLPQLFQKVLDQSRCRQDWRCSR